ncbi:MAG: MFS transporter, partial [Dehalococcoidales bacterium]|nr:MFS transporter [Dehalococcoidales bacterium]
LLIPFFFHNSPVWWLIIFVTANMVLGALANPAWGSMMADLVPVRLRGRYFGVRGRITGFITVAFSLIAGFILQQFAGNVFIGFAILFGGAAVFRFISLYYLYRMWEPPISREQENSTSLPQIILSTLSTNPGRFTLFVSLIFFASNIASPFFAVYMLRDLNYDYTDYTINITAYFVATIAFQTFWGRRGDYAGNLSIIRFTSYLLPAVPIVWLISANRYFLIAAQVFSGFAWAGFNLAATNFLYDATEDGSRTKYIAFFNAMTGISICVGAVIGGYIIPLLPPSRGNNLLTLFLISGMLRGIVVLALLNRITEVREVPRVGHLQLLTGKFNNGNPKKITDYQAK